MGWTVLWSFHIARVVDWIRLPRNWTVFSLDAGNLQSVLDSWCLIDPYQWGSISLARDAGFLASLTARMSFVAFNSSAFAGDATIATGSHCVCL
jgi:hypothetical protein